MGQGWEQAGSTRGRRWGDGSRWLAKDTHAVFRQVLGPKGEARVTKGGEWKTYTTPCSTRCNPIDIELNSTPTSCKSADEWVPRWEIKEKAGTIASFESVALLCGVELRGRDEEDSADVVWSVECVCR